MKWVGLTGGIATGKSTVARLIESHGHPVIDADAISHQLTRPAAEGYFQIVSHFGNQVLEPNGFLDRKKLAEIIFQNPNQKLKLENILHPLIQEQVKELKNKYILEEKKICFYDVPLLFEKKLQAQYDDVVTVWCQEEIRLRRLCQRNQLDRATALQRIRQQLPQSIKIAQSQYCIDNSGSEQSLIEIVRRFLVQYEKNCD